MALFCTFVYLMLLQRFANARDERLSHMIRDIAEGKVDQHWNAAMRWVLRERLQRLGAGQHGYSSWHKISCHSLNVVAHPLSDCISDT